MKRLHWMHSNFRRGDIMPIIIGCIMLLLSTPGFLMVLFDAERNSGMLGVLLLLLLGTGVAIGIWYVALGVRICSEPGSLAYRISHGRIFPR